MKSSNTSKVNKQSQEYLKRENQQEKTPVKEGQGDSIAEDKKNKYPDKDEEATQHEEQDEFID